MRDLGLAGVEGREKRAHSRLAGIPSAPEHGRVKSLWPRRAKLPLKLPAAFQGRDKDTSITSCFNCL